MSETASRQVSPAPENAYQFLAWLVPTLDRCIQALGFKKLFHTEGAIDRRVGGCFGFERLATPELLRLA
ncbi:MAG: hypothetical protein JOZ58_16775 [Acetobacteraceae bacterium]|nr:hypothetical protein [Acetobacteraceae bacterium]